MTTRSFKSKFGTFLLMLLSIGITISTLHSHHHLEWHQTKNVADTGTCISADTTVCPICGHLLQTNLTPGITVTEHFQACEIIYTPADRSSRFRAYIPEIGRAPPALV